MARDREVAAPWARVRRSLDPNQLKGEPPSTLPPAAGRPPAPERRIALQEPILGGRCSPPDPPAKGDTPRSRRIVEHMDLIARSTQHRGDHLRQGRHAFLQLSPRRPDSFEHSHEDRCQVLAEFHVVLGVMRTAKGSQFDPDSPRSKFEYTRGSVRNESSCIGRQDRAPALDYLHFKYWHGAFRVRQRGRSVGRSFEVGGFPQRTGSSRLLDAPLTSLSRLIEPDRKDRRMSAPRHFDGRSRAARLSSSHFNFPRRKSATQVPRRGCTR